MENYFDKPLPLDKRYRMNANTLKWEYWDDTSKSIWNHDYYVLPEDRYGEIPTGVYDKGMDLYNHLQKRKQHAKRDQSDYGTYTGQQGLYTVLSELQQSIMDYRLDYSDDRLQNVLMHLGDKGDGLDESIRSYIETEYYAKKHVKQKNSFRSETDPYSMGLSYIADYLLKPKYKNPEQELDSISLKVLLPTVSESKNKKNNAREIDINVLMHTIERIDNAQDKVSRKQAVQAFNEVKNGKQRFEKFNEKIDVEKFPELKPQFYYIKEQKKNFGYGKSKDIREQSSNTLLTEFNSILDTYGCTNQSSALYTYDIYKYGFKKKKLEGKELVEYLISQRKSEVARKFDNEEDYFYAIKIDEELNNLLRGNLPEDYPVVYRESYEIIEPEIQIGAHSIRLKYEQPIGFPKGYTPKKMLYRMKKQVSEMQYELDVMKDQLRKPIRVVNPGTSNVYDFDYSGVQFSDTNVIYELMINYYSFYETHREEANDVWASLVVFDELAKAALNDDEKYVVHLLKTDYKVNDILKVFNKRMNTEYSDKQIRHMIKKKIPQKVADYFMQDKEEYIMDEYQVSGKKCTDCRLIKLPSRRNFGKDVRNKDGLKSVCKDCDSKLK